MLKEFNNETEAIALSRMLNLHVAKVGSVFMVGNNVDEICKRSGFSYFKPQDVFYDPNIFVEEETQARFKRIVLALKDKSIVDASSLELPYGITNINRMFQNCEKMEYAPIIPASVRMASHTFLNCKSLKQLPEMPEAAVRHTTFMGTPVKEGVLMSAAETEKLVDALLTVDPENLQPPDFMRSFTD